jgi:hypothetical protein
LLARLAGCTLRREASDVRALLEVSGLPQVELAHAAPLHAVPPVAIAALTSPRFGGVFFSPPVRDRGIAYPEIATRHSTTQAQHAETHPKPIDRLSIRAHVPRNCHAPLNDTAQGSLPRSKTCTTLARPQTPW